MTERQQKAIDPPATARPLVSIVIPNHDYARFLPSCARSLLDQDMGLQHVEVIFVDDASADGSVELARGVFGALPLCGLRIVELPRVGRPGPVRNAGLALARGLALMTLDPDDIILPEYLSRCVAALLEGADVAYTDHLLENGAEVCCVQGQDFHPLLLANQNILPPTALFRRELWDRGARFRRSTAYEDWDFWIQLALLGARFVRVAEPLYRYRMHGGNFSNVARRDDAAAKARLVLSNPGFFPSWTVGWAKAVLGGDADADAMGRGIIPILPWQAARHPAV
jgi:glycosyltransferase involved in cell wall biosynthesis